MKTTKQLNFSYYLLFAIYCAWIGILGFVIKDQLAMVRAIGIPEKVAIGIQSFVILYMLASVPGALYAFKKKMAKVAKIEDETEREKNYLRYAQCRMFAIGFGVFLAITAYYLLGDQSMLWCAGISILAQYFCKPTDKKIFMEMNDVREDDPRMGEFL